jgi:hypothetical protein
MSRKASLSALGSLASPERKDAYGNPLTAVGPLTDPWNLETAGVDEARDYYRNQNDQDVAHGDVLGQAVHFAQAAQATTPDPMGMKGLMQALHERQAVISPKSGFSGTGPSAIERGMPSTIFDPLRQESAVDASAPLRALTALAKKRNDKAGVM